MNLDCGALWNVLEGLKTPALVLQGTQVVRLLNPAGRAWLRDHGLEPGSGPEDGGPSLLAGLPDDAERLKLDGDDDLWLVQRREGQLAPGAMRLIDADGLHYRLDRALETCLGLDCLVWVAQFNAPHLREIESFYGRQEASEVDRELERRLHESLRRGEFGASLGGGRYVVVSIASASHEEAFQRVEERLVRLGRPITVAAGPREHVPGVAAGVAVAPAHGRSSRVLLDHAAAAAHTAERHGRGSVWPFSEAMARQMQDDIALESALARALDEDTIHLVYQPKVAWGAGQVRLLGMEALARWTCPRLGRVSPARFIPVAERSGLMPRLGQQIMEKACAQVERWHRQGLAPPPVAVNVSGHQFACGDFRIRFENTLRRFHLRPRDVEIEITESALLNDLDHGIHVLRALRQAGVGIAIDDFGTGYSSLAYLRRFPADRLKIDRSFVVDAEDNPQAKEVLRGIIALARALRLQVVAEGIETPAQRDNLIELGCDTFQGFLFGHPEAPDDFARQWLRAAAEIPHERIA